MHGQIESRALNETDNQLCIYHGVMMVDLSEALEMTALTDTGQKRDHNEDSVSANPVYGLVLVADGMGGHNAGEVASCIAAHVIDEQIRTALPTLQSGASDKETGYTVASIAVKRAIESANSAIHQVAATRVGYVGMGTTIVVGLFYDNRITIAHVGDSRMYRLRGKRMEQMTKDHSVIQELLDQGVYDSMEEARAVGSKNLITRALGAESAVDIDLQEEISRTGDIYLLCSDGLTDMLEEDKIYLTLNKFSANLKLAAEKLIWMANQNGGNDNISVVLARPIKDFAVRENSLWSAI